MLQFTVVLLLTLSVGVILACVMAFAVGWVFPAAKMPVFLLLSCWWMWLGWRYVTMRDRLRG